MTLTLMTCIFCLAANAFELRFDRKGRPYLICRLCHTRSFVRSLEAVRGIAICPTLIAAAIARRKAEPEFREWFDGEIVKTMSFVTSNAVAQPVPVTQIGLPSQSLPVPFEAALEGDPGSADRRTT